MIAKLIYENNYIALEIFFTTFDMTSRIFAALHLNQDCIVIIA